MKNKKFLFTSLILIFLSPIIFSQKKDPKQNNNHKNINDTASFEKAKKSIYDGNWVFEATKYTIAGSDMSSRYSNNVVYYIVIEGDSCHYKLDPSTYTVLLIENNPTYYGNWSCRSEVISTKEDKKGNICQKIVLNGKTVKADVDITLIDGGNNAIAEIYPTRATKSQIVRYSGRIIPLAESQYSKK